MTASIRAFSGATFASRPIWRATKTFVTADLADLAQVEKLVDGVDGIVHLGGELIEQSWDRILQANIIGCYNLFEAARRKKVKRVVFASSNHAVGFYPRQRKIGTDEPVRPDFALRRQQSLRRSARRALRL